MTATVRTKIAARQAATAGKAARVSAGTAEGNETQAFGQDPNKKYAFKMKVVELDSLVASNKTSGEINPDYDQTLQPRIRDRAASELQIDNMARNLTPEALTWDFHQLDKGAPIIGSDRMVESGNGRTLALQRAQENYPEQWDAYQKSLRDNLETHGIDPADVSNMRNPVLVRERITDVDRAEFAQEANQAAVLQMSPLEKAKSDQRLITDASMNNLTVGEGQSVDQALRSSANSGFVKTFVGALPPNEAAGIMRGDGTLNRMGLWRVKAAMFSKTFPGEAGDRLADTFFESVDHTTQNFENAMGDSLPRLARAEALITSGQRGADLSLSTDISKAIDMHARLKEQGLSARDYVAQGSLWGKELNGNQERLLVAFSDQSRSRAGIRTMLTTYADTIINAPNPSQGTLFGGVGVTKQDVFDRVLATSTEKADLVDHAMQLVAKMLEKGSRTSGNWAHAGNPPFRGGSAAGGGLAAIGGKPGHSAHDKLGIVTARRMEVGTMTPDTWLHMFSVKAEGQMYVAKTRVQAAKMARELAREEAKKLEDLGPSGAEEARKKLAAGSGKHQLKVDQAYDEYEKRIDYVRNTRVSLDNVAQPIRERLVIDGRYTFSTTGWKPRPGHTQEEVDIWVDKLDLAKQNKSQSSRAFMDAKNEQRDWERGIVQVEDPINYPVRYKSRGVEGARREVWDGGREAFESLVSNELLVPGGIMMLNFKKAGRGRSYHVSGDDEVGLTTTASISTVVHEMGHGLEDSSPLVGNNARAFLAYRAAGEAPKTLRSLTGNRGYGRTEIAVKDQFIEPYMGKIYADQGASFSAWQRETTAGKGKPGRPPVRATEIISMGLQEMHKSPAKFAKADPEMFDFIYDTARGRPWSAPKGGS